MWRSDVAQPRRRASEILRLGHDRNCDEFEPDTKEHLHPVLVKIPKKYIFDLENTLPPYSVARFTKRPESTVREACTP
jgi:hypothetical protein